MTLPTKSRIVEVPAGMDKDVLRVCDQHQWSSLPVPAESWTTPGECPYCLDDEQDGRRRYAELIAQGLLVGWLVAALLVAEGVV